MQSTELNVSQYYYIPTTNQAFAAIYRVIHKSLWDFPRLGYRSRDGHAEGEHVNRGRDIPNFCPTLRTYWYAPFCFACLGCCAVEFGIFRGTYELPCIFVRISMARKIPIFI